MPEASNYVPTGEGAKLNEFARQNWQERLALFSEVKNKVVDINPHLRIPFKLEKGKPTPLGVFAETNFNFHFKPAERPKGKKSLEVFPKQHRRSAILGRAVFEDDQGRRYRDIDLKGVGVIGGPPYYHRVRVGEPGGYRGEGAGREGLLDRKVAEYDYRRSEQFTKAGIRTSRTVAVIELEELVVNGQRISRVEAIRQGRIDRSFHPAVEVRAFGTRGRVEDLEAGGREYGRELLADAKRFVEQELGFDRPMSDAEYLEWFAKTLGRNVALMHKNGWAHGFLAKGHNITLDCRIVDLDSVEELIDLHSLQRDCFGEEGADKAIEKLAGSVSRIGESDYMYPVFKKSELVDLFQASYDSIFPPEERKKYFSRFERAKKNQRAKASIVAA